VTSAEKEFSSSQGFLVDLCTWFALGGERPKLKSINLLWGCAMQLAAEHRLDRLLALNLITRPLETEVPYKLAEDILAAGRARAEANVEAVKALQRGLREAGIPSLARKGNVYARRYYGDVGLRGQGDNDLFVPKEARSEVERVLALHGYRTGIYSAYSGAIEPIDRKKLLLFQINPDHLPPLARLESDPFCSLLAIDIAFEIGWHGNRESVVEELLAEEFLSPVVVEGVATLSDIGHFFDCALHIYKDAYFRTPGQADTGVSLRKFLDLVLIWGSLSSSARQDVKNRIQRYSLTAQVAWVCFHSDALFGTEMMHTLGLRENYDSAAAQRWRDDDGREHSWRGTMRDRLFVSGSRAVRQMFDSTANTSSLPA
jgi:hypothetical protein